MRTDTTPNPSPRMHGPSLAAGLLIMLAGSAYPPLFVNAQGRADHGLASLLFWAMAAGFVRGVGFVPRQRVWRVLLSGWACALALSLSLSWSLLQRLPLAALAQLKP
jgi:predicted membrane protein